MDEIRRRIQAGELGRAFAGRLVFHNAYGPDKAWFYDRDLAGGGCLMDLGVHLVDLALWLFDFPRVEQITSRCFAAAERLSLSSNAVEDYALAQLDLANGVSLELACSWNLSAGCDAEIEASFFGDRAGARWRNVNGSFFDFNAEWHQGTERETLGSPPDDWGGRAALAWAEQLIANPAHDRARAAHYIYVAEVLDRIYQQADPTPQAVSAARSAVN
ncbi:Gfo/Idh/MocA family protein [Alkalilimnicola ehrlichii]|nr:Gfo/Idh/MocA family oxidoreductase [Alkalilimnicola ehrlichii]